MNVEKVLEKVTREFKASNIKWGLGASGLLSFYDIVEEANDIDIIVSIDDVKKANNILSKLGERKNLDGYEIYSEYFAVYIVDNVSIDLISIFTINSDNFQYKFHFSDESVVEYRSMNRVRVPLLNLVDWYFMYVIMGDPKGRTPLMEKYFLQNSYLEDDFVKFLKYDLTGIQKKKIGRFIQKLREKRGC